ncbi:MAG: chorismate synthase [Streptococcus mutans]|jgi:chorismate synthase (EC 4.2.3.5)|uniref:Chorismate synthase n=1 Tax=Streptococcus mutans serotype c (strain ATCC 700610 / UA159) TaxID=210007 RepID=AROC_STRMU|nr:chorismate synthase [Streptococcus mutans]Q8DUW1.1 RecName: Full=Chorismate synthase; Short=CS; AltName: Full=5-enolpyruvylshikimate-3-phosphate phospholyase [Streptococcus mutans UA159]AAN58500.1 putative chorismate synthase [Streptococcus mutans UA159]AJD55150.1 chorismate synthase [Streptococcus mutans UA159-FR]EMB58230.1 chorismate synthase [Streptococcus mutans 8ID3]EMB82211.1 chorismate synthase [Streptococcus mutans NFSM2]EMC15360.1 chorismate synthase [Streptococcus mutans N66]
MRYFTAGESHGPRLTAIIEGVPAGLPLTADYINAELRRRQGGYGRGGRMKIESDQVEITSGVRHGLTMGSPITLNVTNRDFKNWTEIMSAADIEDKKKSIRKLTKPRPGHADLVGGMKYRFSDLRNSLERSSARETTMRVAVGSVAKRLLEELEITIASHVVVLGGIEVDVPENLTVAEIKERASQSEISVVNQEHEQEIKDYIDQIKKEGNTIGGIIETVVGGVPVGLGSYVQWDRKLDAQIAQGVVSINAFKGVEFGLGFKDGYLKGSYVMDEITWSKEDGYRRKSNNLGGFEGGMTNGQPIVVRGVMKPIPTLYKPLMSVDIETHEPYKASVERSDPTAVPAAAVVMEGVVATVLATEILNKFSSDNMEELKEAVKSHQKFIKEF